MLCASLAFVNLSGSAIYVIVIVIAHRSGATSLEIGAALAIGAAGGVIGAVIAPFVIGKLGRLAAMLTALWATTVLFPVLAIAPGFGGLGATLALIGLLVPSANVVLVSNLLRTVPGRRARAGHIHARALHQRTQRTRPDPRGRADRHAGVHRRARPHRTRARRIATRHLHAQNSRRHHQRRPTASRRPARRLASQRASSRRLRLPSPEKRKRTPEPPDNPDFRIVAFGRVSRRLLLSSPAWLRRKSGSCPLATLRRPEFSV